MRDNTLACIGLLISLNLIPNISFSAIAGAVPSGPPPDISGGTFTGVPVAVSANVNAPEKNIGVTITPAKPVTAATVSAPTTPSVSAAASKSKTSTSKSKSKEPLPPSADRYTYTEPMTNAVVREILIDDSVNGYNGYCACPWNINREGYECGIESAYYRPGGFRLDCYAQDFKGQDFIFYRKTH